MSTTENITRRTILKAAPAAAIAAIPVSTVSANGTSKMKVLASALETANKHYGDAAHAQDIASFAVRSQTKDILVPVAYRDGKVLHAVEYRVFRDEHLISDSRNRARADLMRALLFDGMPLDEAVRIVQLSDEYCDDALIEIEARVADVTAEQKLDEKDAAFDAASEQYEAALKALLEERPVTLEDVAIKIRTLARCYECGGMADDEVLSCIPVGFDTEVV